MDFPIIGNMLQICCCSIPFLFFQPAFGKSVRGEAAAKFLNEKGLAVLDALDAIAAKKHTTVATVALAWLLAQPRIGAPVASATSLIQLDSLLKAPDLTLDKDDLALLEKVSK